MRFVCRCTVGECLGYKTSLFQTSHGLGFYKLCSIDLLGQARSFFVVWRLSCAVQGVQQYHWPLPRSPSTCGNSKCPKILPIVPWGAKSSLFKNCSRGLCGLCDILQGAMLYKPVDYGFVVFSNCKPLILYSIPQSRTLLIISSTSLFVRRSVVQMSSCKQGDQIRSSESFLSLGVVPFPSNFHSLLFCSSVSLIPSCALIDSNWVAALSQIEWPRKVPSQGVSSKPRTECQGVKDIMKKFKAQETTNANALRQKHAQYFKKRKSQ